MSALSQTIQFVDSSVPPITADRYTLTVKQEITELDAAGNAKAGGVTKLYPVLTKIVHIQGERFSIDPRDIDSVFPPEGGAGDYGNENILPHITFSRKTLPWEQNCGVPHAPWLALLVFHEKDEGGIPQIVPAMVGDLSRVKFRPGESPALEKRDSTLVTKERESRVVIATYADAATWEKRPGENDWDPCLVVDVPVRLMHEIAPTKKDLPWLAHSRIIIRGPETREFSAILANRLPLREGISMACLVSLEQMAEFLPPAPDITANRLAATHVRLVVMKAWSFRCGADFQGFYHPLTTGPLALPYTKPDSETPEDTKVKNALAMGYTALDHNTRWGDRAISWYRGPFLPFNSKVTRSIPLPPICEEGYVTGTAPLSSADEALRYDPELGMLDVSYAAAWQLGRLMALRDETFAHDLYQWKRENRRKIMEPQTADVFALLAEFIQSVAQKVNQSGSNGTNHPDGEIHPTQSARDLINDPDKLKKHLAGARAPESVVDRLAKLRRLEGVPMDYLVPDERMLPPESLRFFQVDLNWVYSLVEGAYSVARVSTGDKKQDAATCPHEVYRQVSGFLLRSAIVSGWPTLEAQVEVSSPSAAYKQLRCERITPDILLYLMEVEGQGVITSVTLQVPPENIEFQLPKPKSAPFRDGGRSVVDIQALAQGETTAAHFARKLTGVVIPSLTWNTERECLSLKFEPADRTDDYEWQFLVNDRPFLPPVPIRAPAGPAHLIEMELPLNDDLPHGEIAVRVRPAAPPPRIKPGRWMTSTTLHRPPASDAQPVLSYRLGEDWITAEWPAPNVSVTLAAQLGGAVVKVQSRGTQPKIRAVLKFGDDLPPGKIQVRFRFRLISPATAKHLPAAWGKSTQSLIRLQTPIFGGGETTYSNGVLKLTFFDQDFNISNAGGSNLEMFLTTGQRNISNPVYSARGSGRRVDFTVTPENAPSGRYSVMARVIGQDNHMISSSVGKFISDAQPLRLLGRPVVTSSASTLSWSKIDDAVSYVVVFRNMGTQRESTTLVEASPAPSLDLVSQRLPPGTYQVSVGASGARNSNWSGPMSNPIVVTINN
jgi:hypothetical protein